METLPVQPSHAARNDTNLTDSTHSSCSAERYSLNQFDSEPILIYRYRGKLETSSQKDLCAMLDKDEKLRVTKKPIERGQSYIDVKRHDLYLSAEKERYSLTPNYDSSLASIKVPWSAWFRNALLGQYSSLYIVSPESSPSSSVSSFDSRRTSPTNTWSVKA